MNAYETENIEYYQNRKYKPKINWMKYELPVPNYSYPSSNEKFNIDDMFNEELELSKIKIDEIAMQLQKRQEIKDENISNIQQYQMSWETKLMNEKRMVSGLYGINGIDALDESVIEMEEQKRKEEVTFWKDISDLRLKLVDAIREYKDCLRKAEMLSSFNSY